LADWLDFDRSVFWTAQRRIGSNGFSTGFEVVLKAAGEIGSQLLSRLAQFRFPVKPDFCALFILAGAIT
jgi:hypothetical protein